jgi:hypothetical protein
MTGWRSIRRKLTLSRERVRSDVPSEEALSPEVRRQAERKARAAVSARPSSSATASTAKSKPSRCSTPKRSTMAGAPSDFLWLSKSLEQIEAASSQ